MSEPFTYAEMDVFRATYAGMQEIGTELVGWEVVASRYLATIDALTEQVATLTARLTELEGADIALEDAIAEMRRMREERDEERRKFDKQFAKAWDATDRALIAEATVDRYEVALEMIAEKSSYKESDHRARALAALTGTEPGEGTDVPPPSR